MEEKKLNLGIMSERTSGALDTAFKIAERGIDIRSIEDIHYQNQMFNYINANPNLVAKYLDYSSSRNESKHKQTCANNRLKRKKKKRNKR